VVAWPANGGPGRLVAAPGDEVPTLSPGTTLEGTSQPVGDVSEVEAPATRDPRELAAANPAVKLSTQKRQQAYHAMRRVHGDEGFRALQAQPRRFWAEVAKHATAQAVLERGRHPAPSPGQGTRLTIARQRERRATGSRRRATVKARDGDDGPGEPGDPPLAALRRLARFLLRRDGR